MSKLNAIIHILVTPEEKEMIKKAAAKKNPQSPERAVSSYGRAILVRAAEKEGK